MSRIGAFLCRFDPHFCCGDGYYVDLVCSGDDVEQLAFQSFKSNLFFIIIAIKIIYPVQLLSGMVKYSLSVLNGTLIEAINVFDVLRKSCGVKCSMAIFLSSLTLTILTVSPVIGRRDLAASVKSFFG